MTNPLTPSVILHPGVYDLTEQEYHADPVPGGSLSSTGARELLPMYGGCPAKYRHQLTRPRPPKKEFDLGSAAHHLVLGIGPGIIEIDADSWRTKDARLAADDARADGKIPLLPQEMAVVQDMTSALLDHPDAAALFKPGTGRGEASLFWVGRAEASEKWPKGTGPVWQRARLDWLSYHRLPDGRVVIPDYKTAKSSEPEAFAKAVASYGYHQQAAFYIDAIRGVGMADLDEKDPAFLFVVQEKTEPYLVSVLELGHEELMWGRELNDEARRRWQHCKTTGVWPGYTTGITRVEIPAYQKRLYEKLLDE